MSENIFLIRHFEDEDNLFQANDNQLINNELLKAGILKEIIISKAFESNIHRAYFLTSNKRRALITARAIANRIEDTMPITIEIDPRIREIDQGSYILPPTYNPGDFYPPLTKAWDVYFAETFKNRNIKYRFGDPLVRNGSSKYPEISGYFNKYGENQREFSIRFYSFLRDLLQGFSYQKEYIPIIITHQALIARFKEIAMIAEKVNLNIINHIDPGTLPLLEWEQFQEMYGSKDAFIGHGEITTFSLSTLDGLHDTLMKEIKYLQTN